MSTLTDRYRNAESLLPDTWRTLVVGGRLRPQWIDGGPDFWYSDSTATGSVIMRVDGLSGQQAPLFDHALVAARLEGLLGAPCDPSALPISALRCRGQRVEFDAGRELHLDLATSTVTPTGRPALAMNESASPDGRLVVLLRDHNLWTRDTGTGAERQITTDGTPDFSYGTAPDVTSVRFLLGGLGAVLPPAVLWASDSRRLVTARIDQRQVAMMHLVQARPPDGGRPTLHGFHYAMLGDEHLPQAEIVSIDVESGAVTVADSGPIDGVFFSPMALGQVWWGIDDSEIYWLESGRGAKSLTLRAMDPATGRTRVVYVETGELPVLHHPVFGKPPNVRVLANGNVLWWSDRSGWGHLYLVETGGRTTALTSGNWLVVDLLGTDGRHAYFTGAGREPGHDPYARSFYRVSLATAAVELLVGDGVDHEVVASPGDDRFVDIASWVDQPAICALREASGRKLADLAKADASRLVAAGFEAPERFVAKAADGRTDLYGLLYKPHGLDPAAKYPILDDSYPGPQAGAVSVRYPRAGRMSHDHAPSMAALGFAVVVVEARGTPLRSKAFHMATRGAAGDKLSLDDHVTVIRQLARTRPWLDLDRVGMYGHSGGGYEAARALLHHPDFFKVAVASAGGHDARVYHALWGEAYVADVGDVMYADHACETHADKLVGKLLLVHGELDDNVTSYVTMRFVDALVSANKDFDLLILPGEEHSLIGRRDYWWRRRWDFFVKHLLGQEPPAYMIAPRSIDYEALADMAG